MFTGTLLQLARTSLVWRAEHERIRTVTLEAGTSIALFVRDVHGAPIEGCEVYVYSSDRFHSVRGETDATGRCRFDQLAHAAYSLQLVPPTSFATVDERVVVPGNEIEIELPSTSPIRVRVVDVHGEPISGALVRATNAADVYFVHTPEDPDWTPRPQRSRRGPKQQRWLRDAARLAGVRAHERVPRFLRATTQFLRPSDVALGASGMGPRS